MLDPRLEQDPALGLPRLLPRDHRVRYAVIDCARDLEGARRSLDEFRARWFRDDPPAPEAARTAATELLEASLRLRNAARELLRTVQPESP